MASYKTYWYTWGVLLVLTLGMILAGGAAISKVWIVALLLAGMLAKATLILANFMHLRFERVGLILTVVMGIVFTALALFFGIAPDGVRILHLGQ
ncbi:MAG: hypothetical protein A3H28_07945 [Acidobacteria bacterium RIFCSPLOWO2_02_FULL_61_28]|nr:MAG: hypothetical protein A3H28_07945 [Acidobacteria bacterium RIFCSPLOWO2_02_FULL_61_28]